MGTPLEFCHGFLCSDEETEFCGRDALDNRIHGIIGGEGYHQRLANLVLFLLAQRLKAAHEATEVLIGRTEFLR
jgi:hypothetical protein